MEWGCMTSGAVKCGLTLYDAVSSSCSGARMATSPAFYATSPPCRLGLSRRHCPASAWESLQGRRKGMGEGMRFSEAWGGAGSKGELVRWRCRLHRKGGCPVWVAHAQTGDDASGEGTKSKERRPKLSRQSSVRSKVMGYVEKQAGYAWLAGPVLITCVIVVPTMLIPLIDLLQQSYFLGLAASFGVDMLFVMAADLFLVLADKVGHHQNVVGGPAPWIGPWEYTGYPKGFPAIKSYLTYAGVGIATLALVVSLVSGKLSAAAPVLGPYLALIFVQLAYENLLSADRLPSYPLVPLVYTVYRFRQLARGMELVSALGGGLFLATMLKMLLLIWTLYFGMYLTQLPWLYSTWNSNRAI